MLESCRSRLLEVCRSLAFRMLLSIMSALLTSIDKSGLSRKASLDLRLNRAILNCSWCLKNCYEPCEVVRCCRLLKVVWRAEELVSRRGFALRKVRHGGTHDVGGDTIKEFFLDF
jgi:hypothetical protein